MKETIPSALSPHESDICGRLIATDWVEVWLHSGQVRCRAWSFDAPKKAEADNGKSGSRA